MGSKMHKADPWSSSEWSAQPVPEVTTICSFLNFGLVEGRQSSQHGPSASPNTHFSENLRGPTEVGVPLRSSILGD